MCMVCSLAAARPAGRRGKGGIAGLFTGAFFHRQFGPRGQGRAHGAARPSLRRPRGKIHLRTIAVGQTSLKALKRPQRCSPGRVAAQPHTSPGRSRSHIRGHDGTCCESHTRPPPRCNGAPRSFCWVGSLGISPARTPSESRSASHPRSWRAAPCSAART